MAMYQWSTFKDFHIHCMVTACSTHSTFAAQLFISYSTFGQSEVKCVGCQWALQRECSGQNQTLKCFIDYFQYDCFEYDCRMEILELRLKGTGHSKRESLFPQVASMSPELHVAQDVTWFPLHTFHWQDSPPSFLTVFCKATRVKQQG